MRTLWMLSAALCLLQAAAAQPRFSYDEIAAGRFTPRTVAGVRPCADGAHYTVLEQGSLCQYAYADGRRTAVLIDAARLPGIAGYSLSPDGRYALLSTQHRPIYRRSFTARYYLCDLQQGALTEVAPQVEGKRDAALAPDGRGVVFAAANDLYHVSAPGAAPVRITDDGERNRTINGTTDWVYEEEFVITRAFEFSPDGRRIAYLRFDESRVPEFEMMRYEGELYNRPQRFKYPKAGEANSAVTLWEYDFDTGRRRQIDTGPESDQYIPRIGYTPRGQLWFYRVNRHQNRFEVMLAEGERVRCLYREQSPAYVERADAGTVTFLPDGEHFIVRNETATGWMHLYLYHMRDGLVRALTSGEWEVTQVVGLSEREVYYLSTERSPLQRDLWAVRLDGKGRRRLTERAGTYRIEPSAGMRYYIAYFSNAATPLQVTLHRGDGRLVRVLEDNAPLQRYIDSIRLPRKEFFSLPTERGDSLNAYVIRPEGFDASKRYPVLMTQYSGPGSQQVADRWSVDWEDVMVQHGYVVLCVDGRGTGLRGERFKKCTYGQLGRLEVEDQLSAARWAAAQPWVDPARIGIYGWSYGGFMSLGAVLRGGDLFRMAIAVAPVTSWRYYDSIYTEIYNGLPQENPAGYDDNSPVRMAHLLGSARLLLIHGTGDDNVHLQNTIEMARALIRAGKQFDMALYPDDNHSMLPAGKAHVRRRMIDYTLRNL